jgi:hypothetical protein
VNPHPRDFFAALLSYLVPGLGQIYQGRIGKGLMFMLCLLGLFFYGMYLGSWKNVYLPDTNTKQNLITSWKPFGDVENRPHFAGQFWIGMAAWPAMIQYATYDREQDENSEPERRARAGGEPNAKADAQQAKKRRGFLGDWQRQPSDAELNYLQRNGDKTWDLGWVYTVIAGVLNLLVIYDALAGPVHHESAGQAAVAKETVAK